MVQIADRLGVFVLHNTIFGIYYVYVTIWKTETHTIHRALRSDKAYSEKIVLATLKRVQDEQCNQWFSLPWRWNMKEVLRAFEKVLFRETLHKMKRCDRTRERPTGTFDTVHLWQSRIFYSKAVVRKLVLLQLVRTEHVREFLKCYKGVC